MKRCEDYVPRYIPVSLDDLAARLEVEARRTPVAHLTYREHPEDDTTLVVVFAGTDLWTLRSFRHPALSRAWRTWLDARWYLYQRRRYRSLKTRRPDPSLARA